MCVLCVRDGVTVHISALNVMQSLINALSLVRGAAQISPIIQHSHALSRKKERKPGCYDNPSG